MAIFKDILPPTVQAMYLDDLSKAISYNLKFAAVLNPLFHHQASPSIPTEDHSQISATTSPNSREESHVTAPPYRSAILARNRGLTSLLHL